MSSEIEVSDVSDSSVRYEIGGRKVSYEEWSRYVFHDEPLRLAREGLKSAVEGARCPDHGESPTIEFNGDGLDGRVSACCDKALELVQAAIAS
jgi:hypothetical protein